MTLEIDLDKLVTEDAPYAVRDEWLPPRRMLLADTLDVLVTELRAARKVVEAGRAFVDEAIGWSPNPNDDTDLAIALREALLAYAEVSFNGD